MFSNGLFCGNTKALVKQITCLCYCGNRAGGLIWSFGGLLWSFGGLIWRFGWLIWSLYGGALQGRDIAFLGTYCKIIIGHERSCKPIRNRGTVL